MRKSIAIGVMCAAVFAQAAHANDSEEVEFCERVGEMAKVAMVHRQTGMSPDASWEILSQANKVGLNLKPFWNHAFSSPRYEGARAIAEIDNTEAHYYTLCLEYPGMMLKMITN